MITIENLILSLSERTLYDARGTIPASYFPKSFDRKFILDMNDLILNGKTLSTKQATLSLKLLNRYRDIVIDSGIDEEEFNRSLENPHYNKPLYQSDDRPREIRYLGKDLVGMRFKYHQSLKERVMGLKNHDINDDYPFWNKDNLIWTVRVTPKNVDRLMKVMAEYSFNFDDSTLALLAEMKNAKDSTTKVILNPNKLQINVSNDPLLKTFVNDYLVSFSNHVDKKLNNIELSSSPLILKKLTEWNTIFDSKIDIPKIEEPPKQKKQPVWPLKLTPKHLKIFNYIEANLGRVAIVDHKYMASRAISLSWVDQHDLFPLIVSTKESNFSIWRALFQKIWPDITHCTITNNRDVLDTRSKIILTTNIACLHQNLSYKIKPKQIIIDDVVESTVIMLRNGEALNAMCSEVYSTILLIKYEQLHSAKHKNRLSAEENLWANDRNVLSSIVNNYLVPRLKFSIGLNVDKTSNADNIRTNQSKLLNLFGVNWDLVENKIGN